MIRNHDLLEGYRTQLAAGDDETVRLVAKLTRLRLLDIIAWTIALPGSDRVPASAASH